MPRNYRSFHLESSPGEQNGAERSVNTRGGNADAQGGLFAPQRCPGVCSTAVTLLQCSRGTSCCSEWQQRAEGCQCPSALRAHPAAMSNSREQRDVSAPQFWPSESSWGCTGHWAVTLALGTTQWLHLTEFLFTASCDTLDAKVIFAPGFSGFSLQSSKSGCKTYSWDILLPAITTIILLSLWLDFL